MNKILINLFSLLFLIGITNNVHACCGSCDNTKSSNIEQNDAKSSQCDKTAKKTCCKSKSKKGTFNFNKTNNYSGKKSACSSNKKKCCKSKKKESTEESTEE